MFSTINEIYETIGQEMINTLPEQWDTAWIEVNIDQIDQVISMGAKYSYDGSIFDFDVDVVDGALIESESDEAFYALYHLMQKDKNDIPWNKARFEINNEGDFDIEFKLDEDFKWYNDLDPDGKEFDELDIDIIHQIETWEGLPEDFPRYWKK